MALRLPTSAGWVTWGPTPGGVGGVEAALTAALTTAGVDAAAAASIVLLFRLVTFWLPVVPGWVLLRRVKAKQHV